MKKMIFGTAIAAVIMGGCVSNDSVDSPKGSQMDFNTYIGKTRGVPVTGTTFANGTTVGIIAYQDFTAPDYTNTYGTINNLKLTSDGTTLKPAADVYWPATGDLSFFAYAPYVGGNGLVFNAGTATEAPSLTYTVPTVVVEQIDVMVAEPLLNQTAASNAGTVALPFHHALTQVKFSAKTAADYTATAGRTFTIQSIELKQLIRKGDLTLNYAAPITWTTDGTATDFTIPLIAENQTVNTDGLTITPLNAANGILMMIPQTLTDDMVVEFTYTQSDGTPNTAITKTFKLNEAIVNGNPLAAWAANKVINYCFTLADNNGTPIIFTGSIVDWETETNAGL